MDPERVKPFLVRDKQFLEELYHSSSVPNSKRLLQNASDSKLKTLIIFLHLVSSGQIVIKKQNFEKIENKHFRLFRSYFDKKVSYKNFLQKERAAKLSVLFKLAGILPFLLHTLFNDD